MIGRREFLIEARLEEGRLEAWIQQGWVMPAASDPPGFSEADLAKACLIRDLEADLGINPEGIDVILSLLTQIHGLRRTLRQVIEASGGRPGRPRRQSSIGAARRARRRRE